jgi:hypothetical protein
MKVNNDSGTKTQDDSDLVVDHAGNIYAIWEDYRNGNGDIYFAKSTNGGSTWTDPNIRINTDSGSDSQYHPAIAVDSEGNIYAVWGDYRNGDIDIYFAKSTDKGATWSDPNIKINTDVGTSSQLNPSIAVDTGDNIYVVWEDFRNDNHDIYFSNSSDGGMTWLATNVIINSDVGTAGQYSPSIAINSNGGIYVVWEDYRNGNGDIYFANSTDGGIRWTDPNTKINNDTGSFDQYYPALDVDQADNVYCVWEDNRNGDSDIYFARSTGGGASWTNSDIQINTDVTTDGQFHPDLSLDSDGIVYVAWEDYRNGDSDIYFASSTDYGVSWTDPNLRVNNDTGFEGQYNPSIAVDFRGTIYIIWEDDRNGNYDIFFTGHGPSLFLPYSESLSVDGFLGSTQEIQHLLNDKPEFMFTYRDPNSELCSQYNVSLWSVDESTLLWFCNLTDSVPSGSDITVTYNTAPYPTNGPTLEDGTSYKLMVSFANSTGIWGHISEVEFHMNEVLAPVIPVTPLDDSLIEASTDQTVSWTSPGIDSEGDSPVSYSWEVANDSNFVNIVESGSGTDTTLGEFDTTLSANFYWRVNLTDGWETSSYGNQPDGYWNFTTYTPPGNDPPTITNQLDVPAKAYLGIPLTFTFSASDNDSDPIIWSKVSGPSWLYIGSDNGTIYGTPPSGAIGPNNFTIQVSDGKGGIDSHTFMIEVESTPTSNELPVITNKGSTPTTTMVNTSLSFTFSATDADLDSFYWSKVSGPAWLSIGQTNGTIYGTPTDGDIGSNEFTIQVSDGKGGTDNHTFTIKVQSGSDGDGGDGNGGDGDGGDGNGREITDSESLPIWPILFIIIVVFIVLVLLLLMRMKKPRKKTGSPNGLSDEGDTSMDFHG